MSYVLLTISAIGLQGIPSCLNKLVHDLQSNKLKSCLVHDAGEGDSYAAKGL